MSHPKLIRSILESTLKGLEVDFELKAYSIWGAWEEIVGESIAHQARPRSVRNRILFVDVSHPTWVQHLQFLKPKLLENLNAFLGESLLQDVRFNVGKIPPVPPSSSQTDAWQKEKLAEETMTRINALLQGIKDKEIREKLQGLLVKGAQLDRYRKRSGA